MTTTKQQGNGNNGVLAEPSFLRLLVRAQWYALGLLVAVLGFFLRLYVLHASTAASTEAAFNAIKENVQDTREEVRHNEDDVEELRRELEAEVHRLEVLILRYHGGSANNR